MMKRFKLKRKGERWTTNNRALMGPSKKDPGRNPNFDTEETKLLISLWGDPTIQRTLITTHRKHTVIVKLAEKMAEYGYTRSPEEINTRIKNLKCFYNRLKRDIELGISKGVTWKHFPAMDEIMTRSIFSVRPNEIPKPSLKYQLEVEQEERKRLRAAAKSTKASAPNSEETASESSNDSEDEMVIDESANCDESPTKQLLENEENPLKIKDEVCSDYGSRDIDIDETPLIIPKAEPLVDDDDDDVQILTPDDQIKSIPESMTPKIADYVQISNGNTNAVPIKLVNGNHNTIVQTSPSLTSPGMTQSILFAKQPNSMSNSSKISLVPANFLMHQNKGVPQQIQLRQTPQQRIICTQSNTQPKTGIVTSTADGRMKVLLVNAFQNGKTTHTVAGKESTFTNANIIANGSTFKSNTLDSAVLKNNVPEKPTRTDEGNTSKDPGMELLFTKLILMQTENNEIQRQRLEIERQRMEFEKSIADKLLAALSSLTRVQKSANGDIANARDASVNIEDKQQQPVIIDECNGFPLLTPKLEKMD